MAQQQATKPFSEPISTRMRRGFLVVVVIVLAAAVFLLFKSPMRTDALTLIFTSENLGWLAPCGCGGSNLGGMKYRKSFIDEKHKGAKGPTLLLDTGNFTDGTLAYL